MKKFSFLLLTLIILASVALAQNPADEAYIKAMTVQDNCEKVKLLKDFINKYAGKGSQYENYAYAYLCLLPCPSKTQQESIGYGEKALTMEGLDAEVKSSLLAFLAKTYVDQGQNLDKAKNYASQLIELAKAEKGKEGANQDKWNKIMAAGYFIIGNAAEKAKDINSALDAYLTAYSMSKDKSIMVSLRKMAKNFADAQNYAEAEKVYRTIYNQSKDPNDAILLSQLLLKANKNDEALTLLKEAYAKKKDGEVAFSIAVILANKAKTDPSVVNEAIRYSLEAAFLSKKNSDQAMKMAEGLFFTMNKDLKYNETVLAIQNKAKELDELTKFFNERFGGKSEDELSEKDKKKMQEMMAEMEAMKAEIEKLKAQQNAAIAKFNQLIEETKKRLGVK
ncbi:MAG: tetratricopeptide repeat protein [Candidatus Saccharicenans sp.]